MKLLILEGYNQIDEVRNSYYSIKRLEEEAKDLGIEYEVASTMDMKMKVNNSEAEIFFKDINVKDFDTVIIKYNFSDNKFSHGLLEHCKNNNIRIFNQSSFEFINSYNKISQLIMLQNAGVPIVETEIFASYEELLKSTSEDKLIKPSYGGHGANIALGDRKSLEYLMYSFRPQDILLQSKLPLGTDFRVLVLGDKALGVMKKDAKEGNIVSNFSAGGSVSKFTDPAMEELAVKAAEVMKCEYAGVDIMFDAEGNPRILEVNRNAQFQGFESVTGVNVAKSILEYLKK